MNTIKLSNNDKRGEIIIVTSYVRAARIEAEKEVVVSMMDKGF